VSPAITANDQVFHDSDVIVAECEDELVLLRVETGRCYGLNGIASDIWRRIAAPVRVAELIESLKAEFPAAPEQCAAETLEFLQQLGREGLITRSAAS
jgi:hypothetical protein